MKKALSLVLAFATTSAFAGSQGEDYTACKASVAKTYPDYKKVKIERMRSGDMKLRVEFKDVDSIRVTCDRKDYTLSLKDGTPLFAVVAKN